MGKIKIVRHVRGVTLNFDPLGMPKATRSSGKTRDMERSRKDRAAAMLELLQKSTVEERDILNTLNQQSGEPWEVQNEEDEHGWNPMVLDDTTEDWVTEASASGVIQDLMAEVREATDDNIDVHLGNLDGSRRIDYRTRADRLLRQQSAWSTIYPAMVDAYLQWDFTGAALYDDAAPQHNAVKIYDIFDSHVRTFPQIPGMFFVPTMVQYGYIANSPLNPSCAFSIQLLELFRTMNSRCPQLSIHRFTHGLCDLLRVAYPPSLRNKFSSAYDAYLEVLARISERIQIELGHNTSDWRLKNACPACTFETPQEPPLKYSMLIAIDGNNSLRRMPKAVRKCDENGKIVLSKYIERADSRQVCSDLYLSETQVNEYMHEVKKRSKNKTLTQNALINDATSIFGDESEPGVPSSLPNTEALPVDGVDNPTPCVERWTNLADESSKKMWSVFHETGIFLAVCRHGIALLLCDMIRSGELAKYPLALIDKLIDTYGDNLMIGYDIGCGFSTTAARSPKVGPKVHTHQCRFCVGSFHGHAHCRLCQLDWHPLYIEGCGLEDFETCERCFSESNAVAGATRHASTFHRRQAILNHFTRWNMDKYAEISNFIFNNYRQALRIIAENSGALNDTMQTLNIASRDVFVQWVREEKEYLLSLKKEPENDREVLCSQYVRTLKKLEVAKKYFEVTSRQWVAVPLSSAEESNFYQRQSAATQTLEAARLDEAKARGLDSVLTLQGAIRDLEIKLGIDEEDRWTPDCMEWEHAEAQIDQAEYQSAIDKLEGLVVARLFELSKLNQAGIGVKMRTHIAKALKVRSKAIRKAIEHYNLVASKVGRQHLEIETVLQYVFLAEFDLLRESRYNVAAQPWTRAPERAASILHFKLQRAQEEITRLNVEAKHLFTYMLQEEKKWRLLITRLQETQPSLAFQATKRLQHLSSLNKEHEYKLTRLELLDGYTGPQQIGNIQFGEDDEGNNDEGEADNDRTCEAMDAMLQVLEN